MKFIHIIFSVCRIGFGTLNKIILRFWKPFWSDDITVINLLGKEKEEDDDELEVFGTFDVMEYYVTGEKYLLVSFPKSCSELCLN